MFRHTVLMVLLGGTVAACATSPSATEQTTVAEVKAVFVEVAPDIYVSERLLSSAPKRDYWVKLELPGGDAVGTTTMARVASTLRLAAGDQVTVAMAELPQGDQRVMARSAHRVLDRIGAGALASTGTRREAAIIDDYLGATASIAR